MTRLAMMLLVTASMFVPTAARADDALKQALSALPRDAMILICVPNIKQANADFGTAVHDLGLEQTLQLPSDSLMGLLQQKLPFLEELNPEGFAAVVFLPAQNLPELSLKQALVLSSKNPKAMLEKTKAEAQENGLWTLTLGGQAMFAAIRGENQLVIGQVADTVQAIKDSKGGLNEKLESPAMKAMVGLDLVAWVDAERVATILKPLAETMLFPMMTAQAGTSPLDQKGAEMNKKNIEMLMNGAAAISFGVGLEEAGVVMRGAVKAKPATDLAKRLTVATTDDSLLKGLPDGNYILAGGSIASQKQQEAAYSQVEPMISMLKTLEGVEQSDVAELETLAKGLMMATRGSRTTIEELPSGKGGLIGAAIIIQTTDSGKWLQQLQEAIEKGKKIASTFKAGDSAKKIEEFLNAFTYTPDAEQMDELKVSTMVIDLSKFSEIDEDMIEELQKVIGSEGIMLRLVAPDAGHVVATFGGGLDYLKHVVETTKKDEAPLMTETGIPAVAEHLPKTHNSVYYIALDHGLKLVQSILKALDEEPLPIAVPDIHAPLGIGTTGGEGWLQFDMFVPVQDMRAGRQVVMTMMGKQAAPPAGTETPKGTASDVKTGAGSKGSDSP